MHRIDAVMRALNGPAARRPGVPRLHGIQTMHAVQVRAGWPDRLQAAATFSGVG
jgi:hypothetical protein